MALGLDKVTCSHRRFRQAPSEIGLRPFPEMALWSKRWTLSAQREFYSTFLTLFFLFSAGPGGDNLVSFW
jgi:hypothetical protein